MAWWNFKRTKVINDEARVELIRERLSGHQSDGTITKFDAEGPARDPGEINENGTIEWDTKLESYTVTEWRHLCDADIDVQKAFHDQTTDPTDGWPDDYWANR